MRCVVAAGRQRQAARFVGSNTRYNADMSHRQTRSYRGLDNECMNLLKGAMTEMGLSARAHDKILRVACTIADLDSSEGVRLHHLHKAINYRMLVSISNSWT
jgi:magnesium chelatase family protein